jgi:RNA polymerase sigma factor (TIGR02999 family)
MPGLAGSPHKITQLLHAWSDGNRAALDELLPLVYAELHRQAANFRRKERANHTLQTTAIIHEAYLRLIEQREIQCENRSHFFAIASIAMRRVLVNYANARARDKRGGAETPASLDDELVDLAQALAVDENSYEVLALDQALERLSELDQTQSRVVELRYFSGLSLEETAEALGLSRATVAREWQMAKAWLHRELSK